MTIKRSNNSQTAPLQTMVQPYTRATPVCASCGANSLETVMSRLFPSLRIKYVFPSLRIKYDGIEFIPVNELMKEETA